jgi:hypothetical protein
MVPADAIAALQGAELDSKGLFALLGALQHHGSANDFITCAPLSLGFARELCHIALPPLVRGYASLRPAIVPSVAGRREKSEI